MKIITTLLLASLSLAACKKSTPKPISEPLVALGDSYKGGKVAYIYQAGDPGFDAAHQHGIIAAASDQIGAIKWDLGNNNSIGGTSPEIGTGATNTNKIIQSLGAGAYAAKTCVDYSVTENGITYDDWVLPSLKELTKLYENKLKIGDFPKASYWSSTEFSSQLAGYYSFLNSGAGSALKLNTFGTRAIRYF